MLLPRELLDELLDEILPLLREPDERLTLLLVCRDGAGERTLLCRDGGELIERDDDELRLGVEIWRVLVAGREVWRDGADGCGATERDGVLLTDGRVSLEERLFVVGEVTRDGS